MSIVIQHSANPLLSGLSSFLIGRRQGREAENQQQIQNDQFVAAAASKGFSDAMTHGRQLALQDQQQRNILERIQLEGDMMHKRVTDVAQLKADQKFMQDSTWFMGAPPHVQSEVMTLRRKISDVKNRKDLGADELEQSLTPMFERLDQLKQENPPPPAPSIDTLKQNRQLQQLADGAWLFHSPDGDVKLFRTGGDNDRWIYSTAQEMWKSANENRNKALEFNAMLNRAAAALESETERERLLSNRLPEPPEVPISFMADTIDALRGSKQRADATYDPEKIKQVVENESQRTALAEKQQLESQMAEQQAAQALAQRDADRMEQGLPSLEQSQQIVQTAPAQLIEFGKGLPNDGQSMSDWSPDRARELLPQAEEFIASAQIVAAETGQLPATNSQIRKAFAIAGSIGKAAQRQKEQSREESRRQKRQQRRQRDEARRRARPTAVSPPAASAPALAPSTPSPPVSTGMSFTDEQTIDVMDPTGPQMSPRQVREITQSLPKPNEKIAPNSRTLGLLRDLADMHASGRRRFAEMLGLQDFGEAVLNIESRNPIRRTKKQIAINGAKILKSLKSIVDLENFEIKRPETLLFETTPRSKNRPQDRVDLPAKNRRERNGDKLVSVIIAHGPETALQMFTRKELEEISGVLDDHGAWARWLLFVYPKQVEGQ